MKKKNIDTISPYSMGTSGSFFAMLVLYLITCVVGMAIVIMSFNALIRRHDRQLTGEICTLVTEKMNNSIKYMTTSALNMSDVLSAENHTDVAELYDSIHGKTLGSYVSLGFIDENGEIYATDGELEEFKKWRLLETAEQADPVSISMPYRSGLTGQPVITMFSIFDYKGKHGYMFVTYPLKEIQNMAYTETLSEETEIWLMNAASDNIIQCAGSNKYSIGSWKNALLEMKTIDDDDIEDYQKWKKNMNDGVTSDTVSYSSDGVTYTQVYSNISNMNGWSVVVRLPSSALSSIMQDFRTVVIIFVAGLFVITMLMFVANNKRAQSEKRMLENLSIHDPLTAAVNRRAFDYTADSYLSHAARSDNYVMLFMDIDYFKNVNDRYGHEAGDRILKLFSAALRDTFGKYGIISRYGGDEFVLLLKSVDRGEINEQLGLLREKLRDIKPTEDPSRSADFDLSYSCGAAMFPADARDMKSLQACADTALYAVKEAGRDGYRWYGDIKDNEGESNDDK